MTKTWAQSQPKKLLCFTSKRMANLREVSLLVVVCCVAWHFQSAALRSRIDAEVADPDGTRACVNHPALARMTRFCVLWTGPGRAVPSCASADDVAHNEIYHSLPSSYLLREWSLPETPPCLPRGTRDLKFLLYNLCYPRRRRPAFWYSVMHLLLSVIEDLVWTVLDVYFADTRAGPVTPAEACCFIWFARYGFTLLPHGVVKYRFYIKCRFLRKSFYKMYGYKKENPMYL